MLHGAGASELRAPNFARCVRACVCLARVREIAD